MTPVPEARQPSQTALHRMLVWLNACRFFTISLLIHVGIVVIFGAAVLFHATQEAPDFVADSGGFLVDDGTQLPPPAAPEVSQALSQKFAPPAPTMAAPPLPMLVTAAQQSTFTVPMIPTTAALGVLDSMKDAMASLGTKGLEEAGRTGMAGMGRAGGMANVSFFGAKTKARRIAFLVDYSGSMSGAFRLTMEQELERSLKDLPTGTQVLIIPWAGGAWLYDQLATDIADKWQKVSTYDNFSLRRGEKLDRPEWVSISDDNTKKLMKGILAQKAWPGGTDWRSPFNYVMEANPPADTIFFMTDGQILDVPRALGDIDKALKKTPTPPKVFALWIKNKVHEPEAMRTLAQKYAGEFIEVGAAPKQQ